MDGWMDGRMDGRIDREKDRWMDGRIDRVGSNGPHGPTLHRAQYHPQPYTPYPQTRTTEGTLKDYPELVWALSWLGVCNAGDGIGLNELCYRRQPSVLRPCGNSSSAH